MLITLDSGATVSYLRLQNALDLNLPIKPNHQLVLLADKLTRMESVGEVDFLVSLGNTQLRVRALVMENLQAECFGGTTFHADNHIEANISKKTVSIRGEVVVSQHNTWKNSSPSQCACVQIHSKLFRRTTTHPYELGVSVNRPCPQIHTVNCPSDVNDTVNSPLNDENHTVNCSCMKSATVNCPNMENNTVNRPCVENDTVNRPNVKNDTVYCPCKKNDTVNRPNTEIDTVNCLRNDEIENIPTEKDEVIRPKYQETTLRAISLPTSSLIYPSDYLPVPIPDNVRGSHISITPSFPDAFENSQWPPQVCEVINGFAQYKNLSSQPMISAKFSHFRPHHVHVGELPTILEAKSLSISRDTPMKIHLPPVDKEDYLSSIAINKSILSDD